MIDATTQQRLRNLTIDDVRLAFKELMKCRDDAITTEQEVSLADKPELSPLKCIYTTVSDSIGPSSTIKLIPDPLAVCYIRKMNPVLYEALIEKKLIKKEQIAEYLQKVVASLRDIADDVIHSQSNAAKGVSYEYMQFIGMFVKPDRTMLTVIDKKTKVEDFIYLVLKDIRKQQPELYKQYQEVCRVRTDDTPLMQAVKQTISYKYYAGNTKSFCPLFFTDICRSPQYQAMGRNPKYQLMLLDMIDLCNYLSGSRKGSSIEANGFHYTWSDCNVEASEDTFQKGMHEIVARGWFKVVGRAVLDDGRTVKMYAPSTDWKKKGLSEADLLRIQQHKEGKLKRLKDSKHRFKGKGLKNECETDVPDDLGHT